MPLQIIRNDITKITCDAIVCSATDSFSSTDGVERKVHLAAGEKLSEECACLSGCGVGQAKITGAYHLPATYIIHTVPPKWRDGKQGETQLLASCYRSALRMAEVYHCKIVAFPLLATGRSNFPKTLALQIATEEIGLFLRKHDMLIYLVVYDRTAFEISSERNRDIQIFIDEHYIQSQEIIASPENPLVAPSADLLGRTNKPNPQLQHESYSEHWDTSTEGLNRRLLQMEDSFGCVLLRKIDERGMTDAQCYNKANIDRKLFAKLRSDAHYRPSKATALAYLIALELPFEDAKEMLEKAGYAFSKSNKFDVIVEYFIRARNYNIYEINEALFAFEQPLLST